MKNIILRKSNLYFSFIASFLIIVMLIGVVPVKAAIKSSITVGTRKQLISAIKNPESREIVLRSSGSSNISIPAIKGSENKTLIIEGDGITINNSAVFNRITIKACRKYTENAEGNTIAVNDRDSAITVTSNGSIRELDSYAAELSVTLKPGAGATIISHKKNSSIKLTVGKGASVKVSLEKKGTLTVKGKKQADVSIENKAKSSKIRTYIPSKITVDKKTEIILEKGSEGTEINKKSRNVVVNITNRSTISPDIRIKSRNVSDSELSIVSPTPTVVPFNDITPISDADTDEHDVMDNSESPDSGMISEESAAQKDDTIPISVDMNMCSSQLANDLLYGEIGICDSDSRYIKVKKVHDWMVINISYSYCYASGYTPVDPLYAVDGLHYGWAEITLSTGLGICGTYSATFQLFMNLLGIPCKYVTSESMDHAWNMVYMDDGNWYHVDVTWDDPYAEIDAIWRNGEYHVASLLRNDDGIRERGHYGWDENAPVADGSLYETYFYRSIYIDNIKDTGVPADIRTEVSTGTDGYRHVETWLDGQMWIESVYDGDSLVYTCFNHTSDDPNWVYTKTYDAAGREISHIGSDGNKIITEYTENGRTETFYFPDDSIRYYVSYDLAGREIFRSDSNGYSDTNEYSDTERIETVTDSNGSVTVNVYGYAQDGTEMIRERKDYDKDGNLYYITEYDDLGRIIRSNAWGEITETEYNDDGTTETVYDVNGIIKMKRMKKGDVRIEYTYNENGIISQESTYRTGIESEHLSSLIYYDVNGNRSLLDEFDENGNLTAKTYFSDVIRCFSYDTNGITRTIRDYDTNNCLLEEYIYDSEGIIMHAFKKNEYGETVYTGEYDEDGNWIEWYAQN